MRYIRGFRDGGAAAALAQLIGAEVDPAREYHLMEFCGGHTHAIFRYGVEDLLPKYVRLVHGPGCPVCVLAMPRLNAAIELALQPNITFVSYGDMVRVPASRRRSLLKARAQGADVRLVYSALEALDIAAAHPEREIVFFAIGFETTTPATAHLILEAHRRGVTNLTVYCNHVVTPAAIRSIVDSPDRPGMAASPHRWLHWAFACQRRHRQRPLRGICSDLSQAGGHSRVRAARCDAGGVYVGPARSTRAVHASRINSRAESRARAISRRRRLVAEVLELRPSFEWRGLGALARSAMRIKSAYEHFDAEKRFAMSETPVRENAACQCPSIIRGVKKPVDCTLFGTICTPRSPIGSCMVSAEGVCAAYYKYRRSQTLAAETHGDAGLNDAQRLSIGGCVQGVGYRPYIYRLAQSFQLTGWVRNNSGTVEIHAEGSAERLEAFAQAIFLQTAADRTRAFAGAPKGVG